MSLYGYKKKWKKRLDLRYGEQVEVSKVPAGGSTLRALAKKLRRLVTAPKYPYFAPADFTPSQKREFFNRKVEAALKSLPSETLARRRFKPVSDKKRKSDRLYLKLSREWLKDTIDEVALMRDLPRCVATCVHHIRGRLGTLKFDKRFWCPTTMENGLWPHRNIAEARKLGLLAQAGDWNRAPQDAETARIREWMREKGIL